MSAPLAEAHLPALHLPLRSDAAFGAARLAASGARGMRRTRGELLLPKLLQYQLLLVHLLLKNLCMALNCCTELAQSFVVLPNASDASSVWTMSTHSSDGVMQ